MLYTKINIFTRLRLNNSFLQFIFGMSLYDKCLFSALFVLLPTSLAEKLSYVVAVEIS